MPKEKIIVDLEIESDHKEWLSQITNKFGFPDESKALRVLLDYAIQDGNEDEIFSSANIRCRHCG